MCKLYLGSTISPTFMELKKLNIINYSYKLL